MPKPFFSHRDALVRGTLVVPGALADRLSEGHADNLNAVISLWRAPERISAVADRRPDMRHLDVTAFGEAGLIPAQPGAGGAIAPIPSGMIGAPRNSAAAVPVIETARSGVGTLALRDAIVPSSAFPPGAERSHIGGDDFVDTCYPCRLDADRHRLTVTGS
jgi:hypothetical protein